MQDIQTDDPSPQSVLDQRLYKPEEAAVILQRTVYWLKINARQGLIPHHRIGRFYRFSREDIDAIKDRGAKPIGDGRVRRSS